MIQIYHGPRTRSCRVIWLCEEMGVPYETRSVTFEGPDALTNINPSGTVPLMIDGKRVFTESVTMLEYIAATYGPTPLALAPDHPDYWTYRDLMMFGEATLGAPLNPAIATARMAPEDQKNNWTVETIRARFDKRLKIVRERLVRGPYMMGEAFTLADISVVYPINIAVTLEAMGLKDHVTPDVAAYRDRLAARPAFQKAYAA